MVKPGRLGMNSDSFWDIEQFRVDFCVFATAPSKSDRK